MRKVDELTRHIEKNQQELNEQKEALDMASKRYEECDCGWGEWGLVKREQEMEELKLCQIASSRR